MPAITKNNRALLVVNHLATPRSRTDLRELYRFLEASGVAMAETILGPQYGAVEKLTGSRATKSAFISKLRSLGGRQSIKKIDVILSLHGLTDKISFADVEVRTPNLRQEIAALNLGSKLRLLYSTTCYGNSHADDFVSAGFTAASGSVGVNANAATEYPTVLTMWAGDTQFKDAIAAGENILTRAPADAAARLLGFAAANSDKVIHGDSRIRISSDA